jgi:hypothetical protein
MTPAPKKQHAYPTASARGDPNCKKKPTDAAKNTTSG